LGPPVRATSAAIRAGTAASYIDFRAPRADRAAEASLCTRRHPGENAALLAHRLGDQRV
jgi:hypothetical protein